jgi:hypothetical protein
MGTAQVNPQSDPNPIPSPDQFVDPATLHLTFTAWNYLHSLRFGTQTALQGTVATVTPATAGADNSNAINSAILAVIAIGGGALQLVAGDYSVAQPLVFPAGFNGILLLGNGATIVRAANMPAGQGVFDIRGARQVTVENLTIEGSVTVPQKINYATFSGDPMYAAFTLNTSIWMHAGSEDIQFSGVTIQHTGGYAALSDTRIGPDNRRIKFTRCNLWNNRPFLFGTSNADLSYGSWPGGIFYKGDCSAAQNVGITEDLLVTDCSFERNTGNCVWGHNSGFFNYHRNIRVVDNGFLDCGLDAIEISCTVGGCVIGNVGHRIGYIATDDTTPAYPKYLPGLNATFLDVSGYAENVPFLGNSCTSVCGGFAALDGFCFSAFTGSAFRQPQPGDVLYTEDQIAAIPAGVVYGITVNNSSRNGGGSAIDISANSIHGCSAGSILAIAMRNSKIAANDIRQPANSTFTPILLGNLGPSAVERAYSNSITGNRIQWSPPVPSPAIVEAENWGIGFLPWNATDRNWIEGNHIFDPLGNAFEFQRAATADSTTRRRVSSEAAGLSNPDWGDIRRLSNADGSEGYTRLDAKDGTAVVRVTDALNVGIRGAGLPLYPLDIRQALATSGIHLSDADADNGTYVVNIGDITYYVNGASYNGTQWIARAATSSAIAVGGPGLGRFYFFADTGLTIGNPFTPTYRISMDLAGTLVATGNVFGGGTDMAALLAAIAGLNASKADHGTYPVTGGGGGTVTI